VPLVFFMGVGPFARWKRTSVPELVRILKWALGAGIVAALVLPWVLGRWTPMIALGLLMAVWIVVSVATNFVMRWRATPGGFSGLPNSYLGMELAHLGVAVVIVGITLVGGLQQEKDVRMDVGDTAEAGGYTFRFDGVTRVPGPNYESSMGTLTVFKGDEAIRRLHPEKRVYRVQTMPMTEAAINSNPLRDLYVSLGEPVGGGAWSVRIYYKPFVSWLWGGAFIMALGGFITLTDQRYRLLLGSRFRARFRLGRGKDAGETAH
jgi:cytochrome c-type biogenesis protein CcmF